VDDLEEMGSTALGPALVIAIGILNGIDSASTRTIVLCTDGLANVGLGVLDSNINSGSTFYQDISKLAKESGIVVNVISIRGDDCSMENLGLLADKTSGKVDIVNPVELSSNFAALVSKPILATNVLCTIILHKSFRLNIAAQDELTQKQQNIVQHQIGNVTGDTDVTYSFTTASENEAFPDQITFQIQIEYTKYNTRQLRVLNKQLSSTYDREQAEQQVDAIILGLKTIHQSARYAHKGKYTKARINLISTQRLLQRIMKTREHQQNYFNYIIQSEKLDSFMRVAQQEEGVFGISDLSDSEDNKKKENLDVTRRKEERSDAASKSIFSTKSMSKQEFIQSFKN